MKKTLLVLGALSAFALLFTGCPKSSDSPQKTVGNSDDAPEVSAEPEVLEDRVVYEGTTEVTTREYDGKLNLDTEVDLTGYKYLKVEYKTDSSDAKYRVTIQTMDSSWNQVGIIQSSTVSDDTLTAYTDFGTNYLQDTDYDGTGDTPGKSNKLGFFQIYAQDTSNSYSTYDGIKVTVTKVTATSSRE